MENKKEAKEKIDQLINLGNQIQSDLQLIRGFTLTASEQIRDRISNNKKDYNAGISKLLDFLEKYSDKESQEYKQIKSLTEAAIKQSRKFSDMFKEAILEKLPEAPKTRGSSGTANITVQKPEPKFDSKPSSKTGARQPKKLDIKPSQRFQQRLQKLDIAHKLNEISQRLDNLGVDKHLGTQLRQHASAFKKIHEKQENVKKLAEQKFSERTGIKPPRNRI